MHFTLWYYYKLIGARKCFPATSICNLSLWKVEEKGSGVQIHPWSDSKFQDSPGRLHETLQFFFKSFSRLNLTTEIINSQGEERQE